MKELKEKGFVEEGVIHSKSTKPLSEIRKKRRNSETRKDSLEIREDNYEIREDNSEIHSSNNIKNNINNNTTNKKLLNASIEKFQEPKGTDNKYLEYPMDFEF